MTIATTSRAPAGIHNADNEIQVPPPEPQAGNMPVIRPNPEAEPK